MSLLYLAETATADLVPDATIGVPARLSLDDLALVVGRYGSAAEHERHLLGTQGSGNDLEPDEFRFDSGTGSLESLWLSLPEDNAEGPGVADGWLGLPPVAGTLRRTGNRGFTAVTTTVRWCAEDGGVLACLDTTRSARAGDRLRLRVAEDVDLLFHGDLLAGWLLTNPERYVTSLWEPWPSRRPPDSELGVLLKQYFDLVDDAHAESLFEERDPRGLTLLKSLLDGISLDRGATERRAALRERLGELAEMWYGS